MRWCHFPERRVACVLTVWWRVPGKIYWNALHKKACTWAVALHLKTNKTSLTCDKHLIEFQPKFIFFHFFSKHIDLRSHYFSGSRCEVSGDLKLLSGCLSLWVEKRFLMRFHLITIQFIFETPQLRSHAAFLTSSSWAQFITLNWL